MVALGIGGELPGGATEHAHDGIGADTRDRHSQGARLLQARCRPDVAGRDSHSRIHGKPVWESRLLS